MAVPQANIVGTRIGPAGSRRLNSMARYRSERTARHGPGPGPGRRSGPRSPDQPGAHQGVAEGLAGPRRPSARSGSQGSWQAAMYHERAAWLPVIRAWANACGCGTDNAASEAAGDGAAFGQPLVVIEANLDDATGEQLADALSSLLEAGANDAWVTPVVMKKGRPGHVISALCDEALVEQLARVLMAETGTLGMPRSRLAERRWRVP